jgi:hypothetical protein
MNTSIRRFATLALTLAVASCSNDRTIAPASTLTAPSAAPTAAPMAAPMAAPTAAPSGDLLGGLVGTLTNTLGLTSANGLLRTKPLPVPITVSKTIDSRGGTLSIPAAGVTVVVPRGALSEPTVITMTARAGSLVAYDFAPHGITFAKPLVFNQLLRGTNATILSAPFLKLAYYSDPSLLGATTALVSELITGVGSLLTGTFTAPIKHFSGYLVACGRGAE